MKSGINDLNNHLFEQLERLNDNEYMDKNGQNEIERAKSLVLVSREIIDLGSLDLKANELRLSLGLKKLNSKFLDGDD
ncbi:TPA: hypothetical protein ACGO1T_001903 [Streptococcus suis]